MPGTRSRFAVIFFTVLIDLIGFGIVMPILPFYAQRFGASGLAYGAVLGVYSFMQFVATALLGKLSDRIGRRPLLLTRMLFNAVGYVLFAFAGSGASRCPTSTTSIPTRDDGRRASWACARSTSPTSRERPSEARSSEAPTSCR